MKYITLMLVVLIFGCSEERMHKSFSTHLMFQGDADSALALYSKVFPEAEIQVEQRFGEDDPDKSGRVELARMNLGDQTFIVFDSPPVHNFTFTPAMSIFVPPR